MLFFDMPSPDVIQVSVVCLANNRIHRPDCFIPGKGKYVIDDSIGGRRDTQGVGQYDRCFYISQLFHLSNACQLPESIGHIDCSRDFLLEDVALNLAGAGAFDSFEPNRRKVKWEIGLRYRPINSQLLLPFPVEQDMVELAAASDWECMKEEYSVLSLFPAGHIMARLRPRFNGFYTSKDIVSLRNGTPVTAAGLVVRRQRPHGKVVFITLEDEFGHIPCMVFGKVYEKYEHTFRSAFLIINGRLSRREGTRNVIIQKVKPFNALDKVLQSKDWR